MTYMFQRPHYIEIELPSDIKTRFPQYGLYVYGEGVYSIQLYKGVFKGIPVLFIPGNGGSHKQVRSLASVAYRKSLDEKEEREEKKSSDLKEKSPDLKGKEKSPDLKGEKGGEKSPDLKGKDGEKSPDSKGKGEREESPDSNGDEKSPDLNYDYESPDLHFNFFSVDINGELGALYGPVLERQTEFVTIAIRRILELYDDDNGIGNTDGSGDGNDGSGDGNSGDGSGKNGIGNTVGKSKVKPESVILIGHSMGGMGGMVGRAVYSHRGGGNNGSTITPTMVPLIITQATPHTRPVIVLDQHLDDFYDKVNAYWIMERDYELRDVVLVTVGGGRNDIQVPTTRTNTHLADISTTTADVPFCWLTADHQAIVWCRQLVLATVRGLFDVIDTNTNQLSTNRTKIVDVFKYHLATRVSGKRYDHHRYPDTVPIEKDARWAEITRRQHTHTHAQHTHTRTYLHTALHPGNSLYQHLTIVGIGLETKNWVLACIANNNNNNNNNDNNDKRICKSAVNLSHHTKKLPGKFKMLELDMEQLEKDGYTHILVNIPPTDDMVEVWIDIHSDGGRARKVNLPAFIRSFTPMLVEDATPLQAATYNVTLNGLGDLWQSYQVTVKPRNKCVPAVNSVSPPPAAILHLPWAIQSHSFLYSSGHTGLTYMIELDVPPYTSHTTPSIKFILNPQCTYTIIIQSSLIGVFRRIVLLYGPQVPTYITVHLLLTLSKQLKSVGESGACMSFFHSLFTLTPLAVVPFVKITNLILRNMDIMDDFTIL
ncbi:hypothetical protein Pmani_012576, partial [Petrolisthes manimaculis]